MFDTWQKAHLFTVPAMLTPLDALRAFAEENRDALFDAAQLLGGAGGIRRAHLVLDGLGAEGPLPRRTLRACDELLDLLMLEHVHDPDREEAGRFAGIDPASAYVEEFCLLADTFADALAAYRESTEPGTVARRAAA